MRVEFPQSTQSMDIPWGDVALLCKLCSPLFGRTAKTQGGPIYTDSKMVLVTVLGA